ncbi:IS3 family transposase [Streptomyces alanosinicus]|uniref:IS3 family transposase n=1 Tax=Streptomyces alanosinicus TaxID=68171 RepID=UPI003571076A
MAPHGPWDNTHQGRRTARRLGRTPPGPRGHNHTHAGLLDHGPLTSRFEFVGDHRGAFGVKRPCTVLTLSASGFLPVLKTVPVRAVKKAADTALIRRMCKVHAESGRTYGRTYGAKRITAELRANGLIANRERAERIIPQQAVQGRRLKRRHRTSMSAPPPRRGPDLLRQDVTALSPHPPPTLPGSVTSHTCLSPAGLMPAWPRLSRNQPRPEPSQSS